MDKNKATTSPCGFCTNGQLLEYMANDIRDIKDSLDTKITRQDNRINDIEKKQTKIFTVAAILAILAGMGWDVIKTILS